VGCECAKQEESSGTHLLVYTVGTEKTFYQMVEATLPLAPGPFGNPTIHNDGTIEFPLDGAPPILGYKQINSRSFRPIWPSCQFRILTVTHPEGHLTMTAQCHNTLAERCLGDVTPNGCANCQSRCPIPMHR